LAGEALRKVSSVQAKKRNAEVAKGHEVFISFAEGAYFLARTAQRKPFLVRFWGYQK